jgi:hypothetical protein
MSFNHYFYSQFNNHLNLLQYDFRARSIHPEMDQATQFFGGFEWKNVRRDLTKIPEEYRSLFVLSLFMITVTDQAMFTYFRSHYQKWRERTAFPKFGWLGFGYHNENPMQILWAPEREQVIAPDQMIHLLPDFVAFWINETTRLLQADYSEISVKAFFSSITSDKAWLQANDGKIIPELKRLVNLVEFGQKGLDRALVSPDTA